MATTKLKRLQFAHMKRGLRLALIGPPALGVINTGMRTAHEIFDALPSQIPAVNEAIFSLVNFTEKRSCTPSA